MNHVDKSRGFTLIELTLAMGFVSLLLLAIAMTVIQIGNIYNRGLTLKDVDQSGRSLANELQRSVSESASFDLSSRYINKNWGGRLCIGQYSYVWNYGYAIDPNNLNPNRNVYSPSTSSEIRFVKVLDANASYCTTNVSGQYPPVKLSDAVELLNIGEHYLAIHNFVISTTASAGDSKTRQQLYSIEFLIGTNDQTALKGSLSAIKCLLPSDVIVNKQPDPSYCFVNQFDIVARAGNMVQ